MSDLLLGGIDDASRLLIAALAEWAACMVYVLVARRRASWLPTAAIAGVGLVALAGLHMWTGMLSTLGWALGIVVAVAMMFALIIAALRVSLLEAGYLAAKSFVVAELAASLYWMIVWFWLVDSAAWVRGLVLACVLAAVLVAVWAIERRRMVDGVGWRDMAGAAAIAVLTFVGSNVTLIVELPTFADVSGPVLLYVRALVDLCGAIALFAQQEVRRELQSRRDADAMAQLLRNQHEQYAVSRRAMDEVNRRYHDMRHHLDAVRAESDPESRAQLLDELAESLQDHGDQVRTGNRVVDAVLTGKRARARDDGIEVRYVVDGALLDFMAPLDVTALLGNAIDNALEAARLVSEPRSVQAAVFAHDDFVMLRVENSYDGTVRRSGGRIVSRKAERGHGYGLRSIRAIAERHGGTVSVIPGERQFSLHVLIPRPAERS